MYTLDIPGQVSELQLKAIEAVAQLVPENGCVVEVGSLFGRSSYAWAMSSPQSANVICIDPWEGNAGVRGMEEKLGVKYGLQQFLNYTSDCKNITPIKGYSPRDFQDWDRPVDVYYEDAVHKNPILRQNLLFWTSHLSPGAVICGDDYRPRFPDVVCEVNKLARRLSRRLLVVDFFWCLLPSSGESSVSNVKKRLEELALLCSRDRQTNPFRFTISVSPFSPQISLGSEQTFSATVTNDTGRNLDAWYTGWKLVLRLLDGSSGCICEDAIPIEPSLFPPDIARDIQFTLEVPMDASPGEYHLEVGIEGPEVVGVRSERQSFERSVKAGIEGAPILITR